MARIRTLKGEFFRSEDVSAGGLVGKVLAAGLICAMADDDGRFKASVGRIKGEVFTHDEVTDEQVETALGALAAAETIRIYTVRGRRYGAFLNWNRHQRVPPTRYVASELPPPPDQANRKRAAGKAQAASSRAATGDGEGPSGVVSSGASGDHARIRGRQAEKKNPAMTPAGVVRQVEALIRDGREDDVPATYQHLVPAIRERLGTQV